MNRAIVIAHFHAAGAVQVNLRRLVDVLVKLPARVVFVSTNASAEALASLPPAVETITRPNVGYDFESYRVGIAALGELAALEELVVMNSSMVCIDPERLCRRFFRAPRPDADFFGLTASREFTPHLQSYLVAFSKRMIVSEPFGAWWSGLESLDQREAVIGKHELGMTVHFVRHGFRPAVAFHPTPTQKFHALCRHYEATGREPPLGADGKIALDLEAADALNPTHFLWDVLLDQFGVIKAELLTRNPYSLDLHRVSHMLRDDAAFRALVEDVLGEPAPSSSRAESPPVVT